MSLTLAMNSALSGLRANQSALALTANNLANLNNPDYSRKTLVQETQFIAGVGAGVLADTVQRSVSTLLQRDFREEITNLSAINTENDYRARIQQMFGTVANKNALGDLVNDLSTAMEDLGNSPEISANHFSVVNAAQTLTTRIRDMAMTVQQERQRADSEIAESIRVVEEQMAIIAEVNSLIPGQEALGMPTADLEDRRDQAVNKLAEYMDIQYFRTDRNQLTVLSGSGMSLVNGSYQADFSFRPTTLITAAESYPDDLDGIHFNDEGTPSDANDVTSQITGGKLAALFEARDEIMPSVTDQLDLMAMNVRDQINQVHNRGANTPMGLGTGASDPATLTGNRIFSNTADPLTLQHDVNMVLLDTNGNMVGAMGTLSAGATTPAALQAQIDTFLGANGSAAFNADGQLEIKLDSSVRLAFQDVGPATNDGDAGIQFDADGDGMDENYQGFSAFFGLNDLFITPELANNTPAMENQGSLLGISSNIEVRDDIVDTPAYISRGALSGTPPNLQLGAGNNEVALQLAAAFEQNVTFDSVANGPDTVSTSLSGYAGVMLSYSATTASATENTLSFQQALTDDLESKMLNESGVNMDEELSNMVIFQNAYNAAARVIQTTSEMLDTLIDIA